MSAESQADVGILAVILPECRAVLDALRIRQYKDRHKVSGGTVYWHGHVHSFLRGRQYTLAIGVVARVGNYSSASAATELIQRYRPSILLVSGIAAGVRGKTRIGNVVVSSQVLAYEPGELHRSGDVGYEVPRVDSVPISHSIEQDLGAYQAVPARIERTFLRIHGPYPNPPLDKEKDFAEHVAATVSVHCATIASGEKLLRDPQKLLYLRKTHHGRIEAGEMEAAGIAEACRRAGIPWLLFRGISDFGDEFKDDRFHSFAASLAAATVRDFLQYGLDLSTVSPTTSTAQATAARQIEPRPEGGLGVEAKPVLRFQAAARAAAEFDQLLLHVIRDLTTASQEEILQTYGTLTQGRLGQLHLTAVELLASLDDPTLRADLCRTLPAASLSVEIDDEFRGVRYEALDATNSEPLIIRDPLLLWDCTCEPPRYDWLPASARERPCPVHSHPQAGVVSQRFRSALVEIRYSGLRLLWRSAPEFFPPSVDTIRMFEDLRKSGLFSPSTRSVLDLGCGTGILGLLVARGSSHVTKLGLADWLLTPMLYSAMNVERSQVSHLLPLLLLGLNASWLTDRRSSFDLVVCNPSYLPVLPGFHRIGVTTTVGGTDLLEFTIRNARMLGKDVVLSFSHIAMPEALAAAKEAGRRLVPIGPPRPIPFRNPHAFAIAEYMKVLVESRGLRVAPEEGHLFWHDVQTFRVE